MKITQNSKCPCKSGQKYKKCCKTFHDGEFPKTALLLMKSRFSAYAIGLSDYIIETTYKTHENFKNPSWKTDTDYFSSNTKFLNLKILDVKNGFEESFVTFKATLLSNANNDISFTEKSRFLKEDNRWFYESGEIFSK